VCVCVCECECGADCPSSFHSRVLRRGMIWCLTNHLGRTGASGEERAIEFAGVRFGEGKKLNTAARALPRGAPFPLSSPLPSSARPKQKHCLWWRAGARKHKSKLITMLRWLFDLVFLGWRNARARARVGAGDDPAQAARARGQNRRVGAWRKAQRLRTKRRACRPARLPVGRRYCKPATPPTRGGGLQKLRQSLLVRRKVHLTGAK